MKMTDEVWEALNAVHESFNEFYMLDYLVEKLTEAVMSGDKPSIENASNAISSVLPLLTKEWEDTFQKAWVACGGNVSVSGGLQFLE